MTPHRWRVVVADDEPLARRVIRELLAIEADVTIVAEARTGLEAVQAVRSSAPDLLFLDVEMPDLNGFDVLKAMPPAAQPHTIFVTAYDEFAVRAFEEDALDYLVKPFTDERFRKTLMRARRHFAGSAPTADAAKSAGTLDRLPVMVGRRTSWVDLADVRWIEADDYYARLHTDAGVHLARIALGTLERRLDPDVFVRVHRRALVNRAAVRYLTRRRSGAHTVVLITGAHIPVSERRLRAVRDWLARRGATAAVSGRPSRCPVSGTSGRGRWPPERRSCTRYWLRFGERRPVSREIVTSGYRRGVSGGGEGCIDAVCQRS